MANDHIPSFGSVFVSVSELLITETGTELRKPTLFRYLPKINLRNRFKYLLK